MTRETTERIHEYCDRYGDKFIELMERVHADSLREVAEADALLFLEELGGLR